MVPRTQKVKGRTVPSSGYGQTRKKKSYQMPTKSNETKNMYLMNERYVNKDMYKQETGAGRVMDKKRNTA
jgi:hypothetical protein